MTREEAIISIEEIKDFYGDKNKDGYAIEFVALEKEEIEALDMAIEALQAEPVKHGAWITNKLGMFECTACNTMIFAKQKDWSFCPYCGADMRKKGGEDHETD